MNRPLFLLATLTLLSIFSPGSGTAQLPSDLVWTTNLEDPHIGDPEALRGGTFHHYMLAYPLTFRLVGPNATDAFANWSQANSLSFRLVIRHPVTDKHIPWLATHWSVQPDHRTVYYKLDPDARWSDGEKITASDYVFAFEMLSDPRIIDPFWNTYMIDHFEQVEAIDPYLLKVVGKYESWRPLDDFYLSPMPRHKTHLSETWDKETNLEFPVVPGPYVVSEAVGNDRVVLTRVRDWWGNGKRYFQGLYNVDEIVIHVIGDEDRAFDHFKKGNLSYYRVNTAKTWAEDTDFEAVQKGWVHKKRIFVDFPQGLYGLAMNLEVPLFQNKDFRKAVQYAFDFDVINDELMYGSYYQMVSAFTGSLYQNRDLEPYGFHPGKVREHMAAAGYSRGSGGIWVRGDGQRAAWTLTYGNPGLTRHLTVMKQSFQKLGFDIQLQQIESGASFQRLLERTYEMGIVSQTTELFPDPHQYFASVFAETKNNNNFWGFADSRADSLIDIYRFSMDDGVRVQAMHDLDAHIQDEAFYVPFWFGPFDRMLYWDDVQFPRFYLPKRFEQIAQWQVFWLDPGRKETLSAAMREKRTLTPDANIDEDPWGVKSTVQPSPGSDVTR